MSISENLTHRTVPLLAAAALALPLLGATTVPAEAAASSSWVCSYARSGGITYGKACFRDKTAQVCDLRKDSHRVYGSFSVRSEGVRSFGDGNGAASPCSYQTYAHAVGSASAYI